MNLNTMTTAERERLAYAEGFVETAKLFARLDDMHRAMGAEVAEEDDLMTRYRELIDERDDLEAERDGLFEDYQTMRAQRNELRHLINTTAEALANNTDAREVLAYIREMSW